MEAAAVDMSKDMKGMLLAVLRGGWNGAVGRRRCCGPVAGLPPDGKITGGTFAMGRSGDECDDGFLPL